MKAFNRNSHWKVFSNLIYNSKFCQKISPFYITSESRQPLSFQQKENIVKVDLKHNFLWITFKRVQTSLMFFQIHLHYHIELYFYPLFYSHHHCSTMFFILSLFIIINIFLVIFCCCTRRLMIFFVSIID